MIRERHITVPPEMAATRLDAALVRFFPSTSRALVRQALNQGTILVDGQRRPPAHRLRAGETIAVALLPERSDRRVRPCDDPRISFLHVDEVLVVINKPAGMAVHPIRIGETGTVANVIVARYPETAAIGDPMFPAIVHRLDTDTSGILLAARTGAAYRHLRDQFRRQTVLKEYLAVVRGHPPSHGILRHYLAHHPRRPGHMIAVRSLPADGNLRWMPAETRFEKIAQRRDTAMLRILIRTGVTHQIRCQLAAAGWPILGDRRYGRPAPAASFPARHCLHALALTFIHPGTGREMRLEAPVPGDFPVLGS